MRRGPVTALVEPAGATSPLGVFTRGARVLLLGVALASCAGSGTRNAADATAPVDLGVVNDLSPPPDQGPADAPADDALDVLDASADLPGELGADASADSPDAPSPWGDAPLVDFGGILIPVDPHAVPAPGSECTSDASVRAGDPTIAPPRPIRPLSVSRVTSQRPTFQWVLPAGTTGARVEVCADRCCTRVIQTFDAEGTTARPMTALPPGVVFWRMFGRRGAVVGSRASYTWEFGVRRRDAPNDTTWGTIRDFNGDGYDDVMVFRRPMPMARPADLLFVPGSMEGLRALVATDIVTGILPTRARVGDFNGDGLADLAWDDRDNNTPLRSWITIVAGSRDGLRSRSLPDVNLFGRCARAYAPAVTDWDGDGYSDVVLAVAFGCGFFAPVEASVLLGYLGSSVGIATVPQWAFRLDGRLAHPLVVVNQRPDSADIDRDGYGDVFAVSIFSGSGTTSVPAEHAMIHGVASGDPVIERVVEPFQGNPSRGLPNTVGDTDGDGYVDLCVHFVGWDFVRLHHPVRGWATPGTVLIDPARGAYFGSSISSGDINADGLSDVIVSSETAGTWDPDGSLVNLGRVYIFPGSVGELSAPVWVERERASPEEVRKNFFGHGSMSPGDVNGDGIDDVVMLDDIGSRLCVRHGSAGLATGSPDLCVEGHVPAECSVF
ncbi:MAG: VCBS repeat-containing protein [Myxococcales bacterium]|nr:VCBS repeat-containing protein [Myxococcales bacterium]